MHVPNGEATAQWSRRRILVTILLTSFVAETCAMFLLPALFPSNVHPWIEALADATLLSIGTLPPLWFLLIRPMHADIRESARNNHLLMAALDAHALVSITDAEGRITYANDSFCRKSQFTREELVGRDLGILDSGHHSKSFMKNMWETIAAGKVWHGEVCNRAKDGTLYWVDMTVAPFKDATGHVTQCVAIQTDITDRKEQEDELRHAKSAAEAADFAKSAFLANMSHEIRTPMTAILGFTDTLREEGDIAHAPQQRIEAIDTIHRNGNYLLGLINDILDLSKVEAGKMAMEQVACNPCRIVTDVASLMRIQADTRGLAFNIEYIGAIPETIVSDPTRLRQILINLIGNAIKFTEDGGVRLIIRFVRDAEGGRGTSPNKAYMQFDVLDTGLGMSDEQTAVLFKPFTQADTSTTRKFGGTGLGLTISKRFAELLGGDIRLVDSAVGVGTRFRATVATGPLDGVKMLENAMSSTATADMFGDVACVLPSDLRGLRILLAEDGPDNQRLISFVLKKAGADVAIEENGEVAMNAALAARDEGKPFDVILMDMQMPVMDGYEATGQLRQKGYTAPIIALTAHAMASDREKCINAGCDGYATKPIDRKKLIETIHEHVRDGQSKAAAVQTESPEQPPSYGWPTETAKPQTPTLTSAGN